jgi:hypothetical protein
MFDLEQSIANWRQQMLAAGIKAPVPLEELESHLREEIERQIKSGMDAQRAFEITVSQIGEAKELKTEFATDSRLMSILEMELGSKRWEATWMPRVVMLTITLAFLSFGAMVLFKPGNFSELTFTERMSALAALLVSYLLFSAGFWGYRFFPVILSKWTRTAIIIPFVVFAIAWEMIFLTHINCSVARFCVAFCWAFFIPMGALNGLIWGLETAAQKNDPAAA